MPIFIVIASLCFVSACTNSIGDMSNKDSSSSVRPSITGEKYASGSQKTIPSPTYGTGRHNITIYADFQCPACINFSEGLGKIFESYADAGRITITYKQFPLTSIHKNAYRDAIAALCVAEQGEYMDGKKALYDLEKKKAGANVSDEDRINALTAIGVDRSELTQCLAENRYAQQIDEEITAGDKLGVNGTPTVLLDGTKMDLGVIFADMEKGKAFLDRVFAQ